MTSILCPKCKKQNPEQSKVCVHCGFPLEDDASVTQVDDSNIIIDDSESTRLNSTSSTANIPQSNPSSPEPSVRYLGTPKSNNNKILIGVICGLVFVLIFVVLLISNQKNRQAEAERVLDSLRVEEQKMAAYNDSIQFVSFTSSDLKMLGLHGKVKRVVYTSGRGQVIPVKMAEFDSDGLIIKEKSTFDFRPVYIRRDNRNRIISLSNCANAQCVSENFIWHEFAYSDQDYVIQRIVTGWEAEDRSLLKWDERGFSNEIKRDGGAEGFVWESTSSFDYSQFDEYGNWTEVKEIITTRDGDYNQTGGINWQNSERQTNVIRRTIEYYDRDFANSEAEATEVAY